MTLFRSLGAALENDGTGTEPIDWRKALEGLFTGVGVLPGGASPLVTGNSTMAYSVGVGHFVTQRAVGDGFHLLGNDGTVLVGTTGVGSTVPAAPGSGLQRIDIIWVRQRSNGENGDTTSAPDFGVTSGDPQSVAVAPTIPAGALEIGRNLMTSGVTSTAATGNTITQTAAVARLRGTPGGEVRRWTSIRSTTDTVASDVVANNTSVTIPAGEALPGVYLAIGRHTMGQNDAIGTVSSTMTTPAGTVTHRRTEQASSFADVNQQETFVITTGGSAVTVDIKASTTAGTLTVFTGSSITVTRVLDL